MSPAPASPSTARPIYPRNTSTNSELYLPQGPDVLILPEGPVGGEAAELLHEFVHPHHAHAVEDTLVNADEPVDCAESPGELEDRDREEMKKRPWYKRPSPYWLLCMIPFSAMAMASTIAPRVEIYTELACREYKPEYSVGRRPTPLGRLSWDEAEAFHPRAYVGASYGARILPYLKGIDGSLNGRLTFDDSPPTNDTIPDKDTRRNLCATDPEVQAAVAKLMATMTSVMGVLGCLTTAWWGSFSDRAGRLSVMGISVIGLLLTDFNFIFVSFFSDRLPGGYWFLILGPLVEGSLGGMTSAIAAMHAYVADTSAPSARSRIFSLSLGLLFTGMAFGPVLGGLLIHTTRNTLSVFYLATSVHLFYAILVWFIVPESLSVRAREASRKKRAEERADAVRAEHEEGAGDGRLMTMMKFQRIFAFLSPLSVFAPMSLDKEVAVGKRKGKDWSLTLLVLGYAFSVLIMSSYSYKFQYAAATFGWSSEEMGYWLSLVGASRAFYLTLVLPIAIKFFKAKKPAVQLPVEPSELLHPPRLVSPPHASTAFESPAPSKTSTISSSSSPTLQSSPATTAPVPAPPRAHHSPAFDLSLARFSLVLEVICYTLIPLAPSAASFTLFSMLASFGAGFNPAVQSLALELYARRGAGANESGRLFGALSVVQALCSQIIGPAVFGLTYMKTVATYPKTIFFMSAAFITCSLIFISFVRLPKETPSNAIDAENAPAGSPRVDREQTLVDTDE